MNAYVASTLTNAGEAQAVAEALEQDGWSITYKWWTHGSVQAEGDDRIREVATAEMGGVVAADLVVVVLPGGRGTHVELGMALAAPGRPRAVLIFGRGEERMAHWASMPQETYDETRRRAGAFQDRAGICAFYLCPECVLVEKDRGVDGLRLEALREWRRLRDDDKRDVGGSEG